MLLMLEVSVDDFRLRVGLNVSELNLDSPIGLSISLGILLGGFLLSVRIGGFPENIAASEGSMLKLVFILEAVIEQLVLFLDESSGWIDILIFDVGGRQRVQVTEE